MKFLKNLSEGAAVGMRYNRMLIKKSKWYIIPIAINIMLAPIIGLITLILVVKSHRASIVLNNLYNEMILETEEG